MNTTQEFCKKNRSIAASVVTWVMCSGGLPLAALAAEPEQTAPVALPTLQCADDNEVLAAALMPGDGSLADLRLQQGANINAKASRGKSIVWLKADNAAAARYLSEKGADASLPDNEGRTPIQAAGERKHPAIAANMEAAQYKKSPEGTDADSLQKGMFDAIAAGNVPMLKALLESGVKPELADADGMYAIHYAAGTSDAESMEVLLGLSVPINVSTPGGRTPLHVAAEAGRLAQLAMLLVYGADCSATDAAGATPLQLALQNGHAGCADMLQSAIRNNAKQQLLGMGIPPERYTDALLVTVAENKRDVLALLIQAGADVNAKHDVQNVTHQPLSTFAIAALLHRAECVRLLRAVPGADTTGWSPLTMAIASHDCRELAALIKQGEDVNAVSSMGETPLTYAIAAGYADCVEQLLMAATIDPNRENVYGVSPLWQALEQENVQVLNMVLAAPGVRAAAADEKGCNLLHHMIKRGKTTHFKNVLSVEGMDINHRNQDGATPLLFAVEQRQEAVADALLEAGADVSIKDKDGRTAMDAARESGYEPCIGLLQRHDKKVACKILADKGVHDCIDEDYLKKVLAEADAAELQLLIDAGLDVTKITLGDKSILYMAVKGETTFEELNKRTESEARADDAARAEVLKVLAEGGATLVTVADTGWTPLHLAALYNYTKCLDELMDGVDAADYPAVLERDSTSANTTALWLAAERGNAEAIEHLLSYGAENGKKGLGKSPIELARERADMARRHQKEQARTRYQRCVELLK